MSRYAVAVVFTVEAEDEDDAYDAVTLAIDDACLRERERPVCDEAASSAVPVPAHHRPEADAAWSIPPLEWEGSPVVARG